MCPKTALLASILLAILPLVSGPIVRTIDFVANALISLMALGARFLNVTP
jgi:hypothetical protein